MFQSAALRRPAIAHPFRRFAAALARALHLRQTRQHLGRLEPHLLRDIGLSPDQARDEATRPLWDAPNGWLQRE